MRSRATPFGITAISHDHARKTSGVTGIRCFSATGNWKPPVGFELSLRPRSSPLPCASESQARQWADRPTINDWRKDVLEDGAAGDHAVGLVLGAGAGF